MNIQKICIQCNKEFNCAKSVGKWKVTCSSECSNKYRESKREIRICVQCGVKFKCAKSVIKKYCSKDCRAKYISENKIKEVCIICGEIRFVTPSRHRSDTPVCRRKECFGKLISIRQEGKGNSNYIGRIRKVNCIVCGKEVKDRTGNKKFCSMECKSEWQRENLRGESNPFYGKHHTEENCRASAERNSKGLCQTINRAIRHTNKMRQWRKTVYERDDWTCRECGIRGGHLNAHHRESLSDLIDQYIGIEEQYEIDPFSVVHDDYFYDVDNGVTYCKDCHKEEHIKERQEQLLVA